jgi:PAS domain S-box-containing protein
MADSPRQRFGMTMLGTVLGGYVLLAAFFSFLGWPLDIPRLTDWFNDGVSMQPNACVLMMVSGAAVVLVQRRAWRPVMALGLLVGLGGALILLQYVVRLDFGFNHQLLFGRTWGQGTTLTPGRVGPPAATSFMLSGMALVLLGRARLQPESARYRRFVPMLGVGVCAIMAFSILGYLFGAKQFYTIPWLSAIALPTTSMLLAVGIGLVISVPEHQPMQLLREHSGAGALARVTLPALLLMIPTVPWLRVRGYERAYYDRGTGIALGTLTLMTGTFTVLWIALMALRRREQALRDSEARYRTLVHVAVHGIITIDERGIIESVNPAAERLFGYSSEELVGQSVALLMPETDNSEHDSFPRNVVTGVRQIIGIAREMVGQRKDGSTFPMELAVSEFQLGSRRYFKGIVVDISQRKLAEQKLRDSEARLRTIIEQLPTGVGVMEKNGTWTLTNSLMDLYVPKAIPSMRSDRLSRWRAWDEEGRPIPPEHWPGQRALRGETVLPGLEMRYTHDDGRELWMRISAAPLRDEAERIIGATCVVQDITHLKQAEQELRQRAEELEKLMDVMPVAVWIARDPACRQITGNRAGYELLRVPSGQNLSKSAPDGLRPPGFRVFHDGRELSPEELPMQFAAEHKMEVRDFEEDIVFDDGQVVRAFGSALPLLDEQGSVRGCIAAFMDVTELRRLEGDLQETVKELAAAHRRKDEFLATLAHELRNPLAPVMNSLEILERTDGNDPTAVEARASMQRQIRHMVRLIDDLLDVSRISRGTIELRKNLVDLQDVVRQSTETVGPICEAAGQKLVLDLPDQPLWTEADAARLVQIIGNLVTNASRYSSRGSQIRIRAERCGSDLRLSVSDQGMGIPPDKLETIFEMFRQLDRSLERSAGGLGIGLYLVKRLVELHGGTVTAMSEGAGKGSEFVVRLSAAARPPDVIERLPPPELYLASSSVRSLKVLVVDDNIDAAQMMAMLLRAYGHVTHVVHDGLQAVAGAERLHPDVILLDIGLPGLNGYEACRRIRAQPRGKDVVVVALSGWGREQDKSRAETSGFDAHLVKPVEVPELIGILTSLLNKHNEPCAPKLLDAESS